MRGKINNAKSFWIRQQLQSVGIRLIGEARDVAKDTYQFTKSLFVSTPTDQQSDLRTFVSNIVNRINLGRTVYQPNKAPIADPNNPDEVEVMDQLREHYMRFSGKNELQTEEDWVAFLSVLEACSREEIIAKMTNEQKAQYAKTGKLPKIITPTTALYKDALSDYNCFKKCKAMHIDFSTFLEDEYEPHTSKKEIAGTLLACGLVAPFFAKSYYSNLVQQEAENIQASLMNNQEVLETFVYNSLKSKWQEWIGDENDVDKVLENITQLIISPTTTEEDRMVYTDICNDLLTYASLRDSGYDFGALIDDTALSEYIASVNNDVRIEQFALTTRNEKYSADGNINDEQYLSIMAGKTDENVANAMWTDYVDYTYLQNKEMILNIELNNRENAEAILDSLSLELGVDAERYASASYGTKISLITEQIQQNYGIESLMGHNLGEYLQATGDTSLLDKVALLQIARNIGSNYYDNFDFYQYVNRIDPIAYNNFVNLSQDSEYFSIIGALEQKYGIELITPDGIDFSAMSQLSTTDSQSLLQDIVNTQIWDNLRQNNFDIDNVVSNSSLLSSVISQASEETNNMIAAQASHGNWFYGVGALSTFAVLALRRQVSSHRHKKLTELAMNLNEKYQTQMGINPEMTKEEARREYQEIIKKLTENPIDIAKPEKATKPETPVVNTPEPVIDTPDEVIKPQHPSILAGKLSRGLKQLKELDIHLPNFKGIKEVKLHIDSNTIKNLFKAQPTPTPEPVMIERPKSRYASSETTEPVTKRGYFDRIKTISVGIKNLIKEEYEESKNLHRYTLKEPIRVVKPQTLFGFGTHEPNVFTTAGEVTSNPKDSAPAPRAIVDDDIQKQRDALASKMKRVHPSTTVPSTNYARVSSKTTTEAMQPTTNRHEFESKGQTTSTHYTTLIPTYNYDEIPDEGIKIDENTSYYPDEDGDVYIFSQPQSAEEAYEQEHGIKFDAGPDAPASDREWNSLKETNSTSTNSSGNTPLRR